MKFCVVKWSVTAPLCSRFDYRRGSSFLYYPLKCRLSSSLFSCQRNSKIFPAYLIKVKMFIVKVGLKKALIKRYITDLLAKSAKTM